MKKVIAGLIYVVYSAFLVFAISFGSPLYSDIYKLLTQKNVEISDVEVKLDAQEEMIIGKLYNLEYSVVGKYRSDTGLRFQSLDKDKMAVSSKGAVRGIDNGEKGDYITARLRIYSIYDKNFEKIVTLTFKKVYPESFKANYYVHSVGTNAQNVYLGFPVNVYSSPASGQTYTVKTYELVYDSEYFRFDEETKLLIPIKTTSEGEKITVGVRYENGSYAESREFVILEPPEFYGFDEIRCNNKALEDFSIKQGAAITLTYYKDGIKQIVCPKIIFTEGENGSINQNGRIVFKTPGIKHITLSVGDEYTREIIINVKNTVSLPDMPELDDALAANNTISIDYYDTASFEYTFDKSVNYRTMKYEYDKDIIRVSVAFGKITITPKNPGQTTLKIYLDDGNDRVEREFIVEITGGKSASDKINSYISENRYLFVSKILGHMLLFTIFAPICMIFVKTFKFEKIWQNILFLLATSLPLAFLTEFIQMFFPGRSPRFADVLIDMSGFLIGTLISFLVVKTVKKIQEIASH